MKHLDWDDMKLFLALVRGGTLREAADRAGVSYSTVSRRIDAFEARIGSALFEKSQGRGQLTQVGEDVFSTAEEMEERIHAMQRRSFGQDRALEGPITIAILDALALSPLMDVFAEFTRAHPLIDLNLRVCETLDDLERGQADLALRFGLEPQAELIGRRLAQTGRAVYCSMDYLEKMRAGHAPEWICFTPRGDAASWKQKTRFPDAGDTCYISHMPAQLRACKAGMGIASLPCFLVDEHPDLARLSDPDYPAFQTLWLLRHKDTRNNARLRMLADFIAAEMRRLLPFLRGETKETTLFP